MALTKTANLMLLLLLAGSTDAFATPRARVARGGASSAKARDAVLLNWLLAKARDSDDLPPTKPKPLAVELAVDVGIVAATLGLFRRAGCIRARDCGPRTVLAARLFFAFHLADFPIVVLIVLRATTRKARLEGWVYMVHHSLVVAVWGGVFLAGRCAPFALVGMVCELTSVFVNVRKLLHLTGRGSGALYVLNGIVLLLAWYATRVAAYFGCVAA